VAISLLRQREEQMMLFMMQEIVRNTASRYHETHYWWEWQIPVYLFLGGITAGIMILTALKYFSKSETRSEAWGWLTWMPPVLISVGMFALWLDLSSKLNAWRFYLTFEITAPMSWGAWILLLVYPATILYALSEKPLLQGIGLIRKLTVFATKSEVKSKIAGITVGLGVVLGIYTGILLSNLVARPLWNSAILGPLFLISGLSTGAAFMLLFKLSDTEKSTISKYDIGFIILEILLLAVFLLSLLNGTAIQQEAVWQIVGGPYTAWFWSFVVLIGLIFPLALSLYEKVAKRGHSTVIPVLVLIGGLTLRWILVYAGQVTVW
jgi:protein NrfD